MGLSRLSGLGALTSGIERGADAALRWSEGIQSKDANDILLRQARDVETARQRAISRRPGGKPSGYKTRDPFFKRFAEKFFGGDEDAAGELMGDEDAAGGLFPSISWDAQDSFSSQVVDPALDTSLFKGNGPTPLLSDEAGTRPLGAMPSYADGGTPTADQLARAQQQLLDEQKMKRFNVRGAPVDPRIARAQQSYEQLARAQQQHLDDQTLRRINARWGNEQAAETARNQRILDKVGRDVSGTKGVVTGPVPEAAATGKVPAPGLARRAIDTGKGVGRFAGRVASGALAAGAVNSAYENWDDANSKLEGYYRRIGRDPARAGEYHPIEHPLMRLMGASQDAGNAVLSLIPGGERIKQGLHTDAATTEGKPRAAIPATPAAAPKPSTPPAAPVRVSGPSNPRRGPGNQAIPAGPSAAPAGPKDWSQLSPMDIPSLSTKDWEQYREEAVTDLVYRGVDEMTAMKQVDDQVISMQMNGFKKMFQMGTARLQMGDERGGLALLKAAFQYMPTTTDVKFGKYNGTILAVGVDEDTGEAVGTPLVVEPENLSKIMENFMKPGVWAEYAQDRRQYREIDVPKAQSEINARGMAGVASMLAAAQPRGASSGLGGLKFSDRAGQTDDVESFADQLTAQAVGEDGDEEEMAQIRPMFVIMLTNAVKNHGMTAQEASTMVGEAMKRGGNKLAELAQAFATPAEQ